ncbi:MAG: amidohydrolase family protein [Telmatospirillum sp.]|nr:amidohydrolase family protein [Telmatospirillum sp.]
MITRRHLILGAAAFALAPGGRSSGAVPGSRVDCHAHVFTRDLPLVGDRRYAPAYDAGPGDYLSMLDALGSGRGVLVQPSFLGTDNSFLLAVLRRHPDRLRGIVVVAPDIAGADLRDMAAAGAVGVRLNLIGRQDPDLADPVWRRHLDRLAALGWQVEIQVEARRLPGLLPPLLDRGLAVVIDHFGKPDPDLGVRDPGFQALLAAGATGHVWVKLSAPYRNGPRGGAIAAAAIPMLRDHLGLDHLVWGSDWPHTQFEGRVETWRLRDEFNSWFLNHDDRIVVLSETPARLFQFNHPL